MLKQAPAFVETRFEDVFGRLAFDGPSKSLSEMEAGVLVEARRRHAGIDTNVVVIPNRRRPGTVRQGQGRDRSGRCLLKHDGSA